MITTQNHLLEAPTPDSLSPPIRPLGSYFFFLLIMLYLATMVCEGPLRYFLFNLYLEELLYIRELIPIIIIMLVIIRLGYQGVIVRLLVFLFIIFIFHSIVGYYYLDNYLMIAFGWKIMLSMVFGVAAYPIISLRITSTVRYFCFFLIVALAGVLINFFVEFPWEGLTYSIADQVIEGVKSWHAWGIEGLVKRISGFTRASYDAAIQLLLLGIFVLPYLKRFWIKAILWMLIGVAIIMTNSKGMIVSFGCLSIFFMIFKILPTQRDLYQKLLLYAIISACVIPLFSNFMQFGDIKDYAIFANLASFMDRTQSTWPDAFDLVTQSGNLVLGRGMGGLGQSQAFFESHNLNPGDNIFVYAYVYFGVFSILYFYYIYHKTKTINLNTHLQYYLIILVAFIFGIIASVFESPFFNFFLGLALGHIIAYEASRPEEAPLIPLFPWQDPRRYAYVKAATALNLERDLS